jgi:hypothetical protein
LNQASDSACSAQKPLGSSAARFQSFSYSAMPLTFACATNSADGAKVRVSLRTLVMFVVGEDIRLLRKSVIAQEPAPKGQNMSAQGNALGGSPSVGHALKGQNKPSSPIGRLFLD